MYCGNGSAASSSGCTVGEFVAEYCAPGGSNYDCVDGSDTDIYCVAGPSTDFPYPRCIYGNLPT